MDQYTYYKEVKDSEHMLYANEIAMKYNIRTKNNKEASAFVGALLAFYMENTNEEQLYFLTRQGKAKVYPHRIYDTVMNSLIAYIRGMNSMDTLLSLKLKDKNYNFIVKEKESK